MLKSLLFFSICFLWKILKTRIVTVTKTTWQQHKELTVKGLLVILDMSLITCQDPPALCYACAQHSEDRNSCILRKLNQLHVKILLVLMPSNFYCLSRLRHINFGIFHLVPYFIHLASAYTAYTPVHQNPTWWHRIGYQYQWCQRKQQFI